MKLTYVQLGLFSLKTSLMHLEGGSDRELVAAVVSGHHAVTCFLKAWAESLGESMRQGDRSVSFPRVIGALNKQGVLEKKDRKSLELLNKVRNDLEHKEPEFIRDLFAESLTKCIHLIERASGEGLELDIQESLSDDCWSTLIELGKVGDERRKRLECLIDDEVGVYGRRLLEVDAETLSCDSCGEDGVLWRGEDEVDVKCKYCGEINHILRCEICHGLIFTFEHTTMGGSVHQECFGRWCE